jgi:iron-sulfur cluster insertion protein
MARLERNTLNLLTSSLSAVELYRNRGLVAGEIFDIMFTSNEGMFMSTNIIFTYQAAAKVWQLIEEEGNEQLKLRAYVTGGGCSGFKYGFTFDEVVNADDAQITQIVETENGPKTVQLLIDSLSFQYLNGAKIDYQEDIEGERFVISNPNAATTCGCGSSFAPEGG